MIAAAAVIFVASVVIYVHGWFVRGQLELDRHIAEALDVANGPDHEGNVVFFDRQGVTR